MARTTIKNSLAPIDFNWRCCCWEASNTNYGITFPSNINIPRNRSPGCPRYRVIIYKFANKNVFFFLRIKTNYMLIQYASLDLQYLWTFLLLFHDPIFFFFFFFLSNPRSTTTPFHPFFVPISSHHFLRVLADSSHRSPRFIIGVTESALRAVYGKW